MNSRSQLLGMAFAAADVLLEIDGEQRVGSAMGAGSAAGSDPGDAWPGLSIADLFDAPGCARARAAFRDLKPGVRSPAVEVMVQASGGRMRPATLRGFILPELAPAISCALTWTGPAVAVAAVPGLDARGLLKRLADILSLGGTGPELAVDFVAVSGLDSADARQMAERVEARLAAESFDGGSAARIDDSRFAVMRDAADISDLAEIVRAAGAAEGLDLSASSSRGRISRGLDPSVAIRTLRLALDACLQDGVDAGAFFNDRLQRTVKDADRFRSIVRERNFTLAYQPIVSLGSGAVHHFEALARLAGATSAPAESIQLAEDLRIIEGFDLAVAEKALLQMRRPRFGLVKIGINASGVSLGGDTYVEGLLRMTAAAPELRQRLTVEITETAAVADLEGAERRLAALRKAGIRVALDDFGVGAASLDYLRRLRVDEVKIDGGFVRDLATDDRVRTLAGHLVKLCGDLGITTVGEMVETEAEAEVVRMLGVDYGQGWLFGHPTAEPVVPNAAPARARRVGEVASWG